MDSLSEDRRIVCDLIRRYAEFAPSVGEVETEIIFDRANNHYSLNHNGWVGPHRVEGEVLHIDLRDGKVWIQHDGTGDGVAEELVEAGIPRSRIVLAFQHPDRRGLTDYATA